MLGTLINQLCNNLSSVANSYLFPVMVGSFFAAIIVKVLVQYMLGSLYQYVCEFEKRVHRHVDGDFPDFKNIKDYHELVVALMNKTHYEIYELRVKNMRRKLDRVASMSDRLFMIEEGAKRLVQETSKETRYFQYEQNPNFLGTAQFALGVNPYFHRLFGLVPLKLVNNILSILPGLFIIGGIFGTFLGITGGIPQLKYIDPSQMETAKSIMGIFLDNMAFSMNTSVVGIFFSVMFTIINTLFSPKVIYQESIHKMVHSLELLWKDFNAVKIERAKEENSRKAIKLSAEELFEVSEAPIPEFKEADGSDLPPVPMPLKKVG